MNSIRQRPFSVSSSEYPFASHWFEYDGIAMHYVDEGTGIPVLMLHGNPTWSFLYRNVIRRIEGSCRSIAPDYPGFGFSDHPPNYGYTPQEHSQWVNALIDHLCLDPFILVVQDWGGPIGLSIAVERAQDVAGLVILNTWCWPPPLDMRIFSLLLGGALGKYLNLQCNFFARRIVSWSLAHPESKTSEVLKAYTDPFPTSSSRMGTYVFPRSIRGSAEWLETIEGKLARLQDKPVELVWAMQDVVFGNESIIERWLNYFPDAPLDRIADAKHYLQEDNPERVAAGIQRLLDRLGS